MAELVSIKRNVDVSPGQAAPAVFHCSQGDVGSKIILGLLNNGTAYSIPSGVTVTIEGSESNGSIFTPISATASGSDITFYLTGEMTAVAGPAICQAVLKSGSNILGTANFTLEVESSPMGADAPPVFTDAGWTWMLNKLTTEFVPALGDNIIDAIDSKLDKNQGTANSGKYLKVGTDGNIETADLDVTTDKTLSIADKAADAKAVGDELTDLKTNFSHVKLAYGKELFDTESMTARQSISGWSLTGNGLCTSNSSCSLVKYDVAEGDIIYVNLSKDSDGVYQWQNSISVPATGTNTGLIGTPVTVATNEYLTVPTGATFLIVSQLTSNTTNEVKRAYPTISRIDKTLTIDGASADAKVVGDGINALTQDFNDINDGKINIYDPSDTSKMYQGYYTSQGLNGGTAGIASEWGIVVIRVTKSTKIEISGAESNGGAYSAWLNSSDPSDFAKVAWNTNSNNGEKTCETDWLALCLYNFASVYDGIKVLSYKLKDSIEYTEGLSDVLAIRENILTPSMITEGKYWNGTSQGSNSVYRAVTPIRLKKGQTLGIVYVAYAFTGFVPDGGVYEKMSEASGGGRIIFTAPSDGLAYITYTDTADGKQMIVLNGDIPSNLVEPNVPISASLKSSNRIITVAADGTGDYDNPYDAYMSIEYDSIESPVEIRIKSGTYSLNDQLSEMAGLAYYGIQLIHPYVSIIGEDPSTTILTFDGSPSGEQITREEAFKYAIFHFNYDKPYYGNIENLTMRVKNGRYCFHPETAGKSKGNWTVKNCIFDFEGNPNVTNWSGAAVGIGISHGETGHFINCKWENSEIAGVVGHNNGYGYADNPIVVPCANLIFENCNFNNTTFKIDNLSADSPLHDMLYLINCANIVSGEFGFQSGQTEHKWICINEGSEITDDRFDY